MQTSLFFSEAYQQLQIYSKEVFYPDLQADKAHTYNDSTGNYIRDGVI